MGTAGRGTGEKSEEPTPKRKDQARGEGQIARSTDLSQVLGITAAFIALDFLGPLMWEDIKLLFAGGFTSHYGQEQLDITTLEFEFIRLLVHLLLTS